MEKSKCKCGYDKDHENVHSHYQYSIMGWFLFSIGISAHPTKLQYRCDFCDTTIEEISDPEVLKKHVGR